MSAGFTAIEVADALAAVAAGEPVGDVPARYPAVSTDTRAMPAGALFVALVGERFEGPVTAEELDRNIRVALGPVR